MLELARRSFTVYGEATSCSDMFLLGSISKPIVVTALMTLYEQGLFGLEDPAHKFLL